MKLEMTNCIQCGSEMPMGATICPSCGKGQSGIGKSSPYQPRTLLAIALTAAVLFVFNWIKSPAPQSPTMSPPSAGLPSR